MGSCKCTSLCKRRGTYQGKGRWCPPAERPLARFEVVRKHPWFKKAHYSRCIQLFSGPFPAEREFYESLKPVIEPPCPIIPSGVGLNGGHYLRQGFCSKVASSIAAFFGFTRQQKKHIRS